MTGAQALSAADGRVLAGLAAAAVGARLGRCAADGRIPDSPALRRLGASFVTLERAGELRGCVGTLEPVRPLYRDVTHNAVRAMADPRLPPVTRTDWARLDCKVAVLSTLEPLPELTRASLVARLRPGVDGVLLTDGHRRATFLPSVWRRLTDPDRFVAALLAKGGWTQWPAGLTGYRYTTAEYRDSAPR